MKFKILLSDKKFIFQITENYFLCTNEFNYLKYLIKELELCY